ncbi:response regulator [Aquincola tertiaricarbonis]|uniref:Response regulator n=1 Tax=Aquincola tertiaricarbonis TaxID=391953 RepID=A0ABY4S689_AQUTE|nr:response regulator [Aquincola tertiaricarbonis]URI07233.1 response regulator [Aquincola tertiaricarbonis]
MKLVLVVEDEFGNREVLQLLLEAEGYRVQAASNGKAALALLAAEVPALILSDFMMPTMNGAELGQAVRADPALGLVPFVFMSATSEQVVRQSFRDYDAFLVKPFDIDTMLALVKRLCTQGRPHQPTSQEVGDSMRQLLKGIELPPGPER